MAQPGRFLVQQDRERSHGKRIRAVSDCTARQKCLYAATRLGAQLQVGAFQLVCCSVRRRRLGSQTTRRCLESVKVQAVIEMACVIRDVRLQYVSNERASTSYSRILMVFVPRIVGRSKQKIAGDACHLPAQYTIAVSSFLVAPRMYSVYQNIFCI